MFKFHEKLLELRHSSLGKLNDDKGKKIQTTSHLRNNVSRNNSEQVDEFLWRKRF